MLPPNRRHRRGAAVRSLDLQATVDQTNGLVTLNWNDESDNETGFQVQREKYNSKRRKWAGTTLAASVGADVTQATDSPGDGDYRYQARAYNDAGSSAWTDWVEVNVATTGGGGGGPSTKPCRGKKCQ